MFYNGYREDIFGSLWFQFLNSPIYDLNDPIEIYSGTNVIRSRTMGDGFSFTSGDVTWQETDSWLYALRGDWDLTDDLVLTSDLAFQDSEFKTDFWGQRVARIAPEFFIDINSGDGVPFLDYDPSGSGSPATDATNPANYWLDWGFVNGGRDSGDALPWVTAITLRRTPTGFHKRRRSLVNPKHIVHQSPDRTCDRAFETHLEMSPI